MASTAKQICRQARRVSSPRTQCLFLRQSQRPFSHTSLRMAESSTNDDSAPYFNKAFFNRLDAADQAAYRGFTTSERRDMERVDEAIRDELGPDSHANREMRDAIRYAVGDIEEEFPEPPQERERRSQDFFNEGEKEYLGPDRPFQEDDISSMGHADLEQKREIREYARNAAWEMPLLSKLVKPFTPPTTATPLRFRYTTYLGEQHPAAKKVVVEFDPADLIPSSSSTTTHDVRSKFIKLLGPRYNPSTSTARMSSEAHATQAQNKRALGDTIAALLAEAKDATDTFENIPFDFRHHKPKTRLRFPEEWKMTDARRQELEAARAQRLQKEEQRRDTLLGGLVDGIKEIEEARVIDVMAVEAPIMAQAKAPLPKGHIGRKEMGQVPGA